MNFVSRGSFAVRRYVRARIYWLLHRTEWSESGAKSNAESKLPSGERVRLDRLWLVECFPPSCVAALVTKLDAIAVEEEIKESGWSRQWRDHAISARGGLNTGERRFIGCFTRHPTRFNDIYASDLPRSVDRAEAVIEWVTASLTIVTVEFVLAPGASDKLNQSLSRDFSTGVFATRSDVTVVFPGRRRAWAARQELIRLRTDCAAWMKRNLPGAFSRGALGGDIPSCQSMTLDLGKPLDRYADVFDPFQFSVGVDGIDEAWESPRMPGFRLRAPIHNDADVHHAWRHWLLAAHKAGVAAAGAEDEVVAADSYRQRLSPLATLLAETIGIAGLLEGYRMALARLGDGIGTPKRRFRRPLSRENDLINDLNTVARDVHPIVRELAAWHGTGLGPPADNSFVPVPGSFYDRPEPASPPAKVLHVAKSTLLPLAGPRQMWDRFRFVTRRRMNLTEDWISRSQGEAKSLMEQEEKLHDVLESHAAVVAAAASLRVTLAVAVLTVLLLLAAALQTYILLNPSR